MFQDSQAFSGFSVDDLDAARSFYGDTLGLDVSDVEMDGLMQLTLPGGARVIVYAKPDHTPATFTILNFPVDDVEAAVDQLTAKGIEMLRYDGFDQDDKGIATQEGPAIAWFNDPAGNVISVVKNVM
jgi:predicted enzyme related to lactoylglutathione lyase